MESPSHLDIMSDFSKAPGFLLPPALNVSLPIEKPYQWVRAVLTNERSVELGIEHNT